MINLIESFRSPKLPEINIGIPNFIKNIESLSIAKNFIKNFIENLNLIENLLNKVKELGFSPKKFLSIVMEFYASAKEELKKFDLNQILLELNGLIEEAKADIQASIEDFLSSHPTLKSLFGNIENVVKQQRGDISVGLALVLFFIGLLIIAALVVGTGNIAIGQVFQLEKLNKVLGGQK